MSANVRNAHLFVGTEWERRDTHGSGIEISRKMCAIGDVEGTTGWFGFTQGGNGGEGFHFQREKKSDQNEGGEGELSASIADITCGSSLFLDKQ